MGRGRPPAFQTHTPAGASPPLLNSTIPLLVNLPRLATWQLPGLTTQPRFSNDGRVLIASGVGTDRSPDTLASAELYDPSAGTFTAAAGMTTSGRYWVNTATLLRDGRVLITEGSGAELYDPASGTFTVTGNPPFAFLKATLLPDGLVLGLNYLMPKSLIPLRAASRLQAVRPYGSSGTRRSCSRTAKCWLQEVTVTQALRLA